MKVAFGKVTGFGWFGLLPRVELTPDEEKAGAGAFEVSLSRVEGGCVYSLASFSEHDEHSPGWLPDGSAPPNSTAPDMTAQKWMDRIVEAIKAGGHVVDKVEVVNLASAPPQPHLPKIGDNEKPHGEGWKPYGVDPEGDVN